MSKKLALAAVLILSAADAALFWRGLPNYPLDPFGDYFQQAIQYAEPLLEFMRGQISLDALLSGWRAVDLSIGAPPGYVLPAALLSLAAGRSWAWTHILHHLPYLALLLVSVFGLARKLAGERAGWLAAACAFLYPASFGFMRTYSAEFALAAVSSAALRQLVESDFFLKKRPSLWFGACVGWGMLIKYPFAALIAGPLLLGAWHARGDRKRAVNLAAALALALVIAGPCYLSPVRLKHFGGDVLAEAWRIDGALRLFTAGLWEQQLSPLFFILLAAAIPGFWRAVPVAPRLAVFAWALVPIATLALMPHWKHARLLLPHVPAFAVMTGAGLASYLNGRRGWKILAIVMALGALQRLDLTYGGRLASIRAGGFPYYDDTVAWCYVNRARSLARAAAPEALWRDAAGVLGGMKAAPQKMLVLKADGAPFFSTTAFWLNGVPVSAQYLPQRARDWEEAAASSASVLWVRGDASEPRPEDPLYFSKTLRARFELRDRADRARDGVLIDGVSWDDDARRWAVFMKRFTPRKLGNVAGEAALYVP